MKNLTKSEKKFQRVMHEFGQGELKSHGQPVTDQKQAVAIAFSEARKIDPDYGMMNNGGGISEEQAAALAQIYKTGTAKQLWAAWSTDNRIHFLMDHATEYFELMDEDFYKSSKGFSALTYDTLPSPIRKSLLIHHAQGIYSDGGGIKSDNKINEGIDLFEDYENIPPKVQKILDKYADGFEEGDYDVLKKALSEVEKQGYTFDYYLDGQAYDLRKIGEMGKVEYAEKNRLMYNGGSVIGETRAKEIIRNVLADAKANNISLPKLQKFIAEGPEPGVLIEAYSEFSKAVNNGDNPKSLRLNYEDSVRFRNYVMSLLPNSVQRKMHKHYGDGPIKKNFPGYAGGGGIPGSKKKSGPKFDIGDKVMVDDTGYVKKFEGFDITKPATIRGINKSKSGGKTYYFYKLEMANGDKPFNPAEEDTLTLVSMASGGSIPYNLSPSKKKLLDRINTLKATKANAGEAAQKSIQKKIDVLQRQFDYNPSAKEKAMANKGKFALDVPASYSKAMYKKLWAIKVFPQIHKLNGTHSIVVNSKANLNKAYEVFADMLKEKKEKVPSLASISRKL